MRDIEDALPFVLPHAPNCSDLAAFAAIRRAAREICSKAELWTEREIFQISDFDGECTCSNRDAAIVKIKSATMNGRKLEPISIADLDKRFPMWEDETEEATAEFLTSSTSGKIRVYPFETGKLSARLVLKPSLHASSLPDFLIDEYGQELGWGAAMYVNLQTTDDSGANPEKAAMLSTLYQPFLDRLNVTVAKGVQRARMRTKASFF